MVPPGTCQPLRGCSGGGSPNPSLWLVGCTTQMPFWIGHCRPVKRKNVLSCIGRRTRVAGTLTLLKTMPSTRLTKKCSFAKNIKPNEKQETKSTEKKAGWSVGRWGALPSSPCRSPRRLSFRSFCSCPFILYPQLMFAPIREQVSHFVEITQRKPPVPNLN